MRLLFSLKLKSMLLDKITLAFTTVRMNRLQVVKLLFLWGGGGGEKGRGKP